MHVKFTTPDERREYQQHVEDAAEKVHYKNKRLSQALNDLANGIHIHNNGGFTHAEKAKSNSPNVPYPDMDADYLAEIASTINGATAVDFGDPTDDQLQTLALRLSELAEIIESQTTTKTR